ncbi:MAG: urate hydroxylase PuuD [Oligoflexus sp.]
MESYLMEWASFLFRCLHVIAAIAWIGASFYFVWLDNSLVKPTSEDLKNKGVDGELWAVHGGGFYNPQKYLVAPKNLPDQLHWFYWEAYTTWLSGFGLFVLVYLFNANTYLIDRSLFAMTPTLAVILALAFLVCGWIFYDIICRLFGRNDRIVAILVALYVAAASFLATQIFAGRAAFLLVGAMMATIMSANVLMVIIPGQRRTVAALRSGQPVDPLNGLRGKQRSVHNTYFTLPVIFAMLSHHSSLMYRHPNNWLILLGMMTAGCLIRHFFVLRHKAQIKLWYPGLGVAIIATLIIALAPATQQPANIHSETLPQRVDFAEVQALISQHCQPCHSAKPTLMPLAPKNFVLDTAEHIRKQAPMIIEQTVRLKIMPFGNVTQMTDEERGILSAWYEAEAHE